MINERQRRDRVFQDRLVPLLGVILGAFIAVAPLQMISERDKHVEAAAIDSSLMLESRENGAITGSTDSLFRKKRSETPFVTTLPRLSDSSWRLAETKDSFLESGVDLATFEELREAYMDVSSLNADEEAFSRYAASLPATNPALANLALKIGEGMRTGIEVKADRLSKRFSKLEGTLNDFSIANHDIADRWDHCLWALCYIGGAAFLGALLFVLIHLLSHRRLPPYEMPD